ncbi:MAG: hypothetical protein AAB449_02105 [Patescibacteria group bacterium]
MRTWIIGLVVLIIIGIGAYVLVKTDFIKSLFAPKVEVQEPAATEPTVKTFASSTMGISFDYAPEFTLNDAYAYTGFSGKPIRGVSVAVPLAMATGTTLSAGTYVSVEQLPRANLCTGDIFITANVRPTDVMENGVEYSVASSSGAAAGNRYVETVYALKGSKPCTAVRYYIHSTDVGNYPVGTVREFDQAALISAFDTVRRTLLIAQ